MYETLIMLKDGESFSPHDMHELVKDVCGSGQGSFEAAGTSCFIRANDSYIRIHHSAEPHVAEESKEIAEYANMGCADCTSRFEMKGDDMDMLLFNDYLLILERITATDKFFIFDSAQGREFGP